MYNSHYYNSINRKFNTLYKVDPESRIQALKSEIEKLKKEKNELENNLNFKDAEINELKKENKKLKKENALLVAGINGDLEIIQRLKKLGIQDDNLKEKKI